MTMTSLDPNAGGSAGRSMRGRVPVFNPLLNGETFDITPRSIQLVTAEGQHDSGTLAVISTTLENTDGILDSPISFFFGAPPRTELFQGYVVEVTDTQGSAGSLAFNIQVLGPSKVMYEGKPRFWQNRTATGVISDLVNNSGLGFGGHTHSHIWGALGQTDDSDWEMVTSCAKRVGWNVITRYGIVQTLDPLKVYRESTPYCRLVSGLSEIGQPSDRNLIEFSSQKLSAMIKQNLGSKFGYFTTGNEAQTITQTGDFAGFLFESTQLIRDQEEAKVYMDAYSTRNDGWADTAVARIWGDADLWPGMCVEVITTSRKYFIPESDGKWYVRSVGHNADSQQFQTMLFLTRPSSTPTPGYVEQSYKPFWEQETPAKGRPSLTLDDKSRWISSWNDSRLRGLV